MKMKSPFAISAAALLAAAFAPNASAVVTVNYANGSSATSGYDISFVPSASDALNGITPLFTDGGLHPASAGFSVLTNGVGQPDNDSITQSAFFDGSGGANVTNGRYLYDLGSSVAIGSINTFSWHFGSGSAGERNAQNYSVYGSNAPSDLTPTVVDGTPASLGYTLITAVASTPSGIGFAQGVNITDDTSPGVASIGSYQYLLFDIFPSTIGNADHNTFYGEIDVTVVPEPSSAALLIGAGSLLGMLRRRKSA